MRMSCRCTRECVSRVRDAGEMANDARSSERSFKSGRQPGTVHIIRLDTHADKDPGLLGDATDAGVTDDADGEPGGQAGQPDRETCAELNEARVQSHGRLEVTRDENRDDEAVNLGRKRATRMSAGLPRA